MNTTVSPDLLDEELAAITEAGQYPSMRHAMRDALEALLDANPTLRVATAIELFRRKQITLARAAEIAGVGHETMKDLLAERGIERTIDVSPEEVIEGSKRFDQLRRNL